MIEMTNKKGTGQRIHCALPCLGKPHTQLTSREQSKPYRSRLVSSCQPVHRSIAKLHLVGMTTTGPESSSDGQYPMFANQSGAILAQGCVCVKFVFVRQRNECGLTLPIKPCDSGVEPSGAK